MASNKNLFASSVQVPSLRMVLIGTTGTGKSTTANTLVGGEKKVFESAAKRKSVTYECSVAEVERFGTKLVVVDTPGIFDTTMSDNDLKVQLMECTQLACPGVHAFLIIMKIGERDINEKDQKSFELMKKMLGEKFLFNAIVVFTGKEILETDGQNLNDFIADLPTPCREFLRSCKGGFLAISNTTAREQAAKEIIEKVKILVQQNGGYNEHYTNVLFDEQNREINKRMEVILGKNNDIENKINQLQSEKQDLEANFKDGKPTEYQRKQLQTIENELVVQRRNLVDRKVARITANREIDREKTVKKVLVAGGVGAAAVVVGAAAAAATPVVAATASAASTSQGTAVMGLAAAVLSKLMNFK